MRKSVVSVVATLSLALSALEAQADWRYASRQVESTQQRTEMVRYDPALPGNAYLVTFKVYGDSTTKYQGKLWDTYVQNQLIDCSDLTYIVADGVYRYRGVIVHEFSNSDRLRWRSAMQNIDADAGRRVIEFCSW